MNRLFRLAAALSIVALAACDTSPLDGGDEGSPTHPFLYPKSIAARLQVGDVVTLRNEGWDGDFPLVFVERPDGRYLVASNKTLWLYEPTGTLVWRKTLFEETICRFPIVDEDLLFICRTPDDQQQIIRTDLDGAHLSTIPFNTGSTIAWMSLMRDGGAFIFEGRFGEPISKATFTRFGADGQERWARVYPGEEEIRDIAERVEGGFLLAGEVPVSRSPDPGFNAKAVLLALDAQGGEVWRKTFDACPSDCALSGVRSLSGGRFLASGSRHIEISENNWSPTGWLVMVDAGGTVLWELVDEAEDIGWFDLSLLEETADGIEMSVSVRGDADRLGTIKIGADGQLLNRYVWPFAFPASSGRGKCTRVSLDKRTDQALGAMLSCHDLDGGTELGLYNGQIWTEALVLE